MTGQSCRQWWKRDGDINFLTVTADLQGYLQSGKAAVFPPGQRAFMGHPLEDVRAAERVLAQYPSNHGMGVPFVRTTFDVDADFEIHGGFNPMYEGYFFKTPQVPPSATVSAASTMPWLAVNVGVREAKRGNREPLRSLATMVKPSTDGLVRLHIIELLADAADRDVIADWSRLVATHQDADMVIDLCIGFLQRGILRDVPWVVDAYRRHREFPDAYYLQRLFRDLFAFEPVSSELEPTPHVEAFCDDMMRRYWALREKLGREDVPVFRGQLFSVQDVAREVIDRKHGPFLLDLRHLFERSTGIDCTSWIDRELADRFRPDVPQAAARAFLESPEADAYRPAQLYFFRQEVQH